MKTTADNWTTSYWEWLKNNTYIKKLKNGWTEIATPFLDRHNDSLTIYAYKDGNEIRLSDDGYILSDLEMWGCSIKSEQRKRILNQFLNGYGITLEDGALTAIANIQSFPHKNNILLQPMLSVNYMFMLSKNEVQSIFIEDVSKFFDEQNIINTPDVKISGKSGFDYKIDFIIPKSPRVNLPERFIIALNKPKTEAVKNALFAWDDIKNNRPGKDNDLIVFLNDAESYDKKLERALTQYNALPVPWSNRFEVRDKLAV